MRWWWLRREAFVDDRSKSGQDIAQCVAVGGDGMTTNIWEVGVRAAAGKSAASRCHWAGPEPLSGLLLEESPDEEGKSACSRNITRSHRRCITAPSLRALAVTRSWVLRSQRQHQPTAEAMLPATQETQTLAASAQHSKGLRPSHLSACYVGRRSEASCLMRNSAMDDSIGGS